MNPMIEYPNEIVYDRKRQYWHVGGSVLNADDIGALIARAIMGGQKFVSFACRHTSFKVTPTYLLEMMQFSKREGWFLEHLYDISDHKFDPNEPTPGYAWGEARAYRQRARKLAVDARKSRAKGEITNTEQLEYHVRNCLKTAETRLKFSSLPGHDQNNIEALSR